MGGAFDEEREEEKNHAGGADDEGVDLERGHSSTARAVKEAAGLRKVEDVEAEGSDDELD